MNRFFIDELAGDTNSITDKEDIKHISKVLRLDIDDEVEIVDGAKKEYIMKIVYVKNDNICLEKVSSVDIQREDDIKIRLYLRVVKWKIYAKTALRREYMKLYRCVLKGVLQLT